jgi:hypothetical protein
MKYIIDHIPINPKRRPGKKMKATSITIHNTGNPSSRAKGERGWLTNPSNTRSASFHIVVDENEAIECIPLNEVTWHSGTTKGNYSSISIEICESGNYKQAEQNAVELVAKMLHERGWGIDRVKKHQDWSGKYCPRIIIPYWSEFKQRIQKELDKLNGKQVTPKISGVTIFVNGNKLVATGIMKDNKCYLPIRALGNSAGVITGFESGKGTYNNHPLDTTIVINGTGYAWSREIAQVLGYEITWDGATKTVKLNKGKR